MKKKIVKACEIGAKVKGYGALTADQVARGRAAAQQLKQENKNPASWVEDEGIWEKAKAAADKGDYDEDSYWPVVAHIYENMGGTVKSAEPAERKSYDPTVYAAHGEVTGKPSFNTLIGKVNQAIREDSRWDTDLHGYPEGSPGDLEPWCCDILAPDDNGQLTAVIRTDDGRLVRHDFSWDGSKVTMADGDSEPTEVTPVYARDIALHDETIRAGAPLGNQNAAKHASESAAIESDKADDASYRAKNANGSEYHYMAAEAHDKASQAHTTAAEAHKGDEKQEVKHHEMSGRHAAKAQFHRMRGAEIDRPAKSSDELKNVEVVHCRDTGIVIATPKKWTQEEQAEFQYMPGGVSTITAHFGEGSIELTVDCDEATAQSIQASYNDWRTKRPKQKPFVCIEHREEESAGEPESFSWRDEPEPGVYCSMLPSELGVRNVNGRIHRSFSPSFTTDAEYNKASEKNGVLTFPAGARGSKDNPARITGIAFSVGSLTNKPAFKNILPVRAKQAEPQPEQTNKHAEQPKKTMKVKFIKSRGANAAGSVAELELTDPAVVAGDAMPEAAADIVLAREAEVASMRTERKERDKTRIVKAVEGAKKAGSVPPKDEAVLAKALERLDKGVDADFIVEFIENIHAATPDLGQRQTRPPTGTPGLEVTQISLQDASEGVIKATEPQNNLIRAGRFKEAGLLARQAAAIMRAHHMKLIKAGDDFTLRDAVKAATTTDPDSQVGSLAGDLVLMRNLGYLVSKLNFLKFVSTDLSAEPAKFGQSLLTRYITVPDVLTWVPGVGFTSQANQISDASTGTTQSAGLPLKTEGSGAQALDSTNIYGIAKLSAPSTTDKSVILNMFKATEIEFPISLVESTARNLFAEQQGAQTYALAEEICKFFLDTAFDATWTSPNSGTMALTAGFNLVGMVGIKNAMTLAKIPDVGRFALLHSIYHDKLLTDTNLVTAKAILALINKDMSAFESGELPVLYGVKPLESQIAASKNGTLVYPTDPATIGTVADKIGFAGNMSSMLFVSRPPQDWTTTLTQLGIPQTASVRLMTEPDSGLTVMVFCYADNGRMSIRQRVCLMYGAAQGDPRVGIVLTP